jgi:ubiquinone/menaquinone biosynthesis C-methylase UbiE
VTRAIEIDLGFAGLALLRNWVTGDPEVADVLVAEMRTFLAEGHPRAAEVPITGRETADAYHRWAPVYDSPSNPIFSIEAPDMRELLARVAPGRALDAACGTGRQSVLLRDLGHTVVGVDRTPAMLDLARAKIPTGEFHEGLLQALPLPDGSVDLVVCSLALTHVLDLRPPMNEFARVLRLGGVAVLSDVHPQLVTLASQAAVFRGRDGDISFVRNELHPISSYFAAFRSSGLDVEDMREARWQCEHVDMAGDQDGLSAFALHKALDGLPAVLLWSLRKRR